jgi:hypothetical protein
VATTYTVIQGDCLSTIARRFGLTWQELWNAPENGELRRKRKSPDILFPGDQLAIPVPKPLTLTLATGRVHEIKIKAVPVRLRLNLQLNGLPLASTAYRLDVGGQQQSGTTDGAGLVDVAVPLDATSAVLECPDVPFKQTIMLGHLDPADTVTGAQARLQNLGAVPLDVSGELDELTVAALEAFQSASTLDVTGELDTATVAALEDKYGC